MRVVRAIRITRVFTSDDLMNIYQARRVAFCETVIDNILFFTPAYRALGSLVYRIEFLLFGLNSLPYRLVCFSLILGNLYVAYRAAKAIASAEPALLTALVMALPQCHAIDERYRVVWVRFEFQGNGRYSFAHPFGL